MAQGPGDRVPRAGAARPGEAGRGAEDGDLAALDAAIDEARRLGWLEYELEGRLAAAEIDPRRAPALARDARSRGFLNIARRAEAR